MKKVLIAVVVIAGLAAIGYALSLAVGRESQTAGTPQPQTNQDQEQDNQAAQILTMVYTDSGFSPQTLTAKAGDKITIRNESDEPMEFNSDPHPAHTDHPEINAGRIPSGGTVSFEISRPGTYNFHDHLNPGNTGTLIVE